MNILFFDIDGTLVDENMNFPSSTISSIKQAKENGCLIFINTGRTYHSIPEWLNEIHYDGIICGCGTYIRYQDEVIYHHKLTNEFCKKIVKVLDETNCFAFLEGTDELYYDINSTHPLVKKLDTDNKSGFKLGKDIHDSDICFDKLTLWHNEFSNFSKFLKEFENELDYIERADDFGEFIPKGHDKGTGIDFVLKYFDLPLDHAYCFGDSTNDLAMLKFCKHSVALSSGDPRIFDEVEFITTGIHNDGIEFALKHYKLI